MSKFSDDTMVERERGPISIRPATLSPKPIFTWAYGLYDQGGRSGAHCTRARTTDRRESAPQAAGDLFRLGQPRTRSLQNGEGTGGDGDGATVPPAGEWDKIVIMGKQICPDEPLFRNHRRKAAAARALLVDLNLEGRRETAFDISTCSATRRAKRSKLDHFLRQRGRRYGVDGANSPRRPHLNPILDFTLDAPERGSDESPTREMPPAR